VRIPYVLVDPIGRQGGDPGGGAAPGGQEESSPPGRQDHQLRGARTQV
jgi:hypothetical protein